MTPAALTKRPLALAALLLAGVHAWGAPGARAQERAPLSVVASPARVAPGGTLTLDVTAGSEEVPVEDLFGLSFELGYDDGAFSIGSAAEGALMREGLDPDDTVIVFDDLIDQQPAPFSVTRVRPQPGVSGRGVVATFEVAVAPDAADGAYGFTLQDVEGSDPDGNPISFSVGEGSVTVGEGPANEPPVAQDDEASTDEDVPVDVDVLANDSDPDGDALSVSQVSDPAHGTASVQGGLVRYEPAADFAGTDSFTYTVRDGRGGTDQATVTVTVAPVNDPPAFTSAPVEGATEDQPYAYTAEASDADGDALTLSATTLPGWLSFTDNGDGTGELSGTPAGEDVGEHDVVLRVSDGAEAANQPFTITVAEANGAPTVAAPLGDRSLALSGGAFDVDLSGVFSDPDGDALAFSATSSDEGVATAGVSGSTLTLTPLAEGTATVEVTADDGRGGTATDAFELQVSAANQPPSFPQAPVFTAPEAGEEVTIAGDPDTPLAVTWHAAEDPEGDALAYTWQLALTEEFSALLMEVPTEGETQLETTYGALASRLRDEGFEVGDEVDLFQRVGVTDGELTATSEPSRFVVTLGELTSTGGEGLSEAYSLAQNYPNPFYPQTTIRYTLPEAVHVRLRVYDALGRTVDTLVDREQPPGRYEVVFDAASVPSGTYLYEIQAGAFSEARPMVLVR